MSFVVGPGGKAVPAPASWKPFDHMDWCLLRLRAAQRIPKTCAGLDRLELFFPRRACGIRGAHVAHIAHASPAEGHRRGDAVARRDENDLLAMTAGERVALN